MHQGYSGQMSDSEGQGTCGKQLSKEEDETCRDEIKDHPEIVNTSDC